jgi:hypothetical protein
MLQRRQWRPATPPQSQSSKGDLGRPFSKSPQLLFSLLSKENRFKLLKGLKFNFLRGIFWQRWQHTAQAMPASWRCPCCSVQGGTARYSTNKASTFFYKMATPQQPQYCLRGLQHVWCLCVHFGQCRMNSSKAVTKLPPPPTSIANNNHWLGSLASHILRAMQLFSFVWSAKTLICVRSSWSCMPPLTRSYTLSECKQHTHTSAHKLTCTPH